MDATEKLKTIEEDVKEELDLLDTLARRADRYGDNAAYQDMRDSLYRDIGRKVANILRHDSE